MKPLKTFSVFGELVEVMVNREISNGSTTVIVQHVPPGGGPPPHRHANEDETFLVLEGEFELFRDGKWHAVAHGEPVFGPRNVTHTFRNAGSTAGRIMVFASPAGFETYLEELSPYSPAEDLSKILEISRRYGVTIEI